MKKVKSVLFCAATAGLFFLFSCQDPFLETPQMPGGGAAVRGIYAPEAVTASRGGRRSITLEWNEAPNAARYYIYKAATPLDPFERCGQTSETQITFNENNDGIHAGETWYYRVSSVSYSGTESDKSPYVLGSSLAQPVITDIIEVTESESTVTWYMQNEDTYKSKLLFTVFCYKKGESSAAAQRALSREEIRENRWAFTGLAPNTNYEYVVEAYLNDAQSDTEKSFKMDKQTTKRYRPDRPKDLTASRGTAKNKIKLSFKLPDMVNIAGDDQNIPRPLYFKISRRLTGEDSFKEVCSYFGSIDSKSGAHFKDTNPAITAYTPGATVIWEDSSALNRAKKYEYMVQSYVDDPTAEKTDYKDASQESAIGWALSEGTLTYGELEYETDEVLDENTSAKLPLVFEFDPKGESYSYTLVETIAPIEDDDPSQPITNTTPFDLSTQNVALIRTMNLPQARGIYSYAVVIRQNTDDLDTVSTADKVEVTEITDPIVVKNFRVQDGYTNKYVLKWDSYSNRKYVLYMSTDRTKLGTPGTEIKTFEQTSNDKTSDITPVEESFTYSISILPDDNRYFAIKPFRVLPSKTQQGQIVTSQLVSTLGKPEVQTDASYSAITAAWNKTQKADTYRVKYRYAGASTWVTAAEAIKDDGSETFKYKFTPEGNEIDITKAGKDILIQVDALNEKLKKETNASSEIVVPSVEKTTQLVGPAKLDLKAGKGVSPEEIKVSWKKITGANGYYVYRQQFNMTNTAEEGTETIVYFVPADEPASIIVTGKKLTVDSANTKIDTTTTNAEASFADADSRYTLTERYMKVGDYDGKYKSYADAYKNQQHDMVQGYPFRYWVVPVISENDYSSIQFDYKKNSGNKKTGINFYTIQEGGAAIKYSTKESGTTAIETREKAGTGFTVGFGQKVTATKGTYTSNANAKYPVNDGILITWEAPPLLLETEYGSNLTYTVYRRPYGSTKTEDFLSRDTSVTLSYIDKNAEGGTAYEYAIGISNGSGTIIEPKVSPRFIEACGKLPDEKDRPLMLGYKLGMIKMDSVSRGETPALRNELAEEVKWIGGEEKPFLNKTNKWGIDGYTIFVMNRNIDADWHEIVKEISPNTATPTQSCKVKPGMESFTLYPASLNGGSLTRDLLFVMRDYKHFFTVRSYIKIGSDKVYSPDPETYWKYEYKSGTNKDAHITASNNMQNDYVKWGAREVTKDEFILIAAVYAARGICDTFNDTPTTITATKTSNASTTWGGSGSVTNNYVYQGATDANRTFQYSNYKQDLQTRSGQWVTFVTLNGKIWSRSYPIGSYPVRYGEDGWLTVTGPWDTPDLYSGQVIFGRNGNGPLNFGGNGSTAGGTSADKGDVKNASITGRIAVKYPASAAEEQKPYRGSQTPLQFKEEGDTRYQLEEYK